MSTEPIVTEPTVGLAVLLEPYVATAAPVRSDQAPAVHLAGLIQDSTKDPQLDDRVLRWAVDALWLLVMPPPAGKTAVDEAVRYLRMAQGSCLLPAGQWATRVLEAWAALHSDDTKVG